MPTILYGLSGEGSGHASRARALVPFLERAGYTVRVVGYGRATEQLKAKVKHYTDIFGFHIHYRSGKTDLLRTFMDNVFASPAAVRTMMKLDRLMQDARPDVVFSDFEPFSAYASYRHHVPLISVDNQHALTHTALESTVRNRLAHVAAAAVTKLVVPRARHFFITSFTPLRATRAKTTVIAPLVEPIVQEYPTHRGTRIVVYINNFSLQGVLLPVLRTMKESFIVYGARAKSKGNVMIRPFSRAGFLRDLAGARAVIGTAGFSLLSEVLWMGKPMLVLPSQDQFEQLMNASLLESSGYGVACYADPRREDIATFLARVPELCDRLRDYPYRDLSAPLETILKKVKEFC